MLQLHATCWPINLRVKRSAGWTREHVHVSTTSSARLCAQAFQHICIHQSQCVMACQLLSLLYQGVGGHTCMAGGADLEARNREQRGRYVMFPEDGRV